MTDPQSEPAVDELVLEGLVTTLGADGEVNFAPMGPRVDRALTRFVLAPYQSSRTYQNLKLRRAAVFHVIDDVELLAQAAIDRLAAPPATRPAPVVAGEILVDCCRWFALQAVDIDDRAPRTVIRCAVAAQGDVRPAFGFNRAKHAVLEAAILATRVDILPAAEIRQELARLSPLVTKTAGGQERRAFALLEQHIQQAIADSR